MGKNDVKINRWLSEKKRYADLFNGILFDGKQIIHAEELEPADRKAEILLEEKTGKETAAERYRDIVMQWNQGMELAVLAVKSQDKVHYAMPVRNMIYDGLTYKNQIDSMWEKHKAAEDKTTDAEYLSRYKKEDKLKPVITLVFYYGAEPWDGEKDIYGMLGLNDKYKEIDRMKKFIPNYHINLVDAARINDLEVFMTDLQLILGVLKYKNQKDEFIQYIHENQDYFSRVDKETYQVMRVFLNSEKQLKNVVREEDKEEIDMCKALEELYAEGIEQGIEQRNKELIMAKLSQGVSIDVVADFLDMSIEAVKEVVSGEFTE